MWVRASFFLKTFFFTLKTNKKTLSYFQKFLALFISCWLIQRHFFAHEVSGWFLEIVKKLCNFADLKLSLLSS